MAGCTAQVDFLECTGWYADELPKGQVVAQVWDLVVIAECMKHMWNRAVVFYHDDGEGVGLWLSVNCRFF